MSFWFFGKKKEPVNEEAQKLKLAEFVTDFHDQLISNERMIPAAGKINNSGQVLEYLGKGRMLCENFRTSDMYRSLKSVDPSLWKSLSDDLLALEKYYQVLLLKVSTEKNLNILFDASASANFSGLKGISDVIGKQLNRYTYLLVKR